MLIKLLCVYFSFQLIECIHFETHTDKDEPEKPWPGKWFPRDPSIKVQDNVPMGIVDKDCDDGTSRLEIDWFDDAANYTCLSDRNLYLPDVDIQPIMSLDLIPLAYRAEHKCMNEAISYDTAIPTFGMHRPVWPKYGEYQFVPKQRWIHNLEHGAVVMLYHPCANRLEVEKLHKLVTSCLYRHIITPYNLLSQERPLALVTWGKRLEMSMVAEEIVTSFIKANALQGPEQVSRDGQYDHGLIKHADVVSDIDDKLLCSSKPLDK